MNKTDLRTKGLLLIILSTLISIILSMTADMTGAELGAMFNLVLPPFAGLIAIIIFLIVCRTTKDKTARIVSLTLLCAFLIYVGLTFRFRNGYLPVPFG